MNAPTPSHKPDTSHPDQSGSSPTPANTTSSAHTEERKRRLPRLPFALAGVAAGLVVLGVVPRLHEHSVQTAQTSAQRDLVVATVTPKPAPDTEELLLPGSVMPWADAAIYARTSGYIEHWYADIGTRVRAGQMLAQIKTPELDAQLAEARADFASARADFSFAQSTAKRWQTMLETQSVSQQDTNAKSSDSAAKQARLAATHANVQRLEELVGYERVAAPFDGIVTVRNVDVGALVTAGGTPGIAAETGELFHVEQTDRLRVFVDVPQQNAAGIVEGMQVWVTAEQFPSRRLAAVFARSAGAIDPVTRTLHAEVDVENRDGALLPGAYVQVHLALRAGTPTLELPVSALLFRPDGVTIAVVDTDNRVQLKKITIARDFGTYVEIATGLTRSDRVIDNPGDAITTGQRVRTTAKDVSSASTSAPTPVSTRRGAPA